MPYKRFVRGRNKKGQFTRVKWRGRTNYRRDRQRHAKHPGWRKSHGGRLYYENRRNRSDALDFL